MSLAIGSATEMYIDTEFLSWAVFGLWNFIHISSVSSKSTHEDLYASFTIHFASNQLSFPNWIL